jgi:hypothetical protein
MSFDNPAGTIASATGNRGGAAWTSWSPSSVGNKNARNLFYAWGIWGKTVMLFVIIGGLTGLLLGLRFKVFVLVPSILILTCAIVATGDGWKAIGVTIFATAVLVQIGYLIGLVGRIWARRCLRWNGPRQGPSKSNSTSV